MLVERSQFRMIPLKIVNHAMQVLPRGHIHRPRHKQLSLDRLLVINLSKCHFLLKTLLLHQQNIKRNPLHRKVRHPLAKHTHRNQLHLQKHQQKHLQNHQQHLDQVDKADWPLYEQMCREKLMRLFQRPRKIQNTQVNHGLMMIAKTPSKIAKRPNDGSENILHRTTSVISASSWRKLAEH